VLPILLLNYKSFSKARYVNHEKLSYVVFQMVILPPFTVGTVELENLRQKSCNTDVRVVLTIHLIPETVYHCMFHLYYHEVIEIFFTENKRKIKLSPCCHIHTHLKATLVIVCLLPVLQFPKLVTCAG